MDAATYWAAVGSVGTAVGSLLALFAIVLTALLYRKQRNDQDAALIREDMRAFISATNGLIRALRDGSPFIAAAWSARAVFQEALPSGSDLHNLRDALKKGDIGLSVAAVSWERSSEAEALRSRVTALVDSSRRLTGNLNILSNAGEMLIRIADDAKTTFSRLLTNKQVVAMFLENTEAVTRADDFLNALANHLHGNTALYFVTRYEQSLQWLDQLITEAAIALGELDAGRLLAVAKAKSTITTDTRTAELRVHVSALARLLPAATTKKLEQLIDRVEESVSNASAQKRLADGAQQAAPTDVPASGAPHP